MGLLTFSINVTLDGCVDHQEGIADDETTAFFTRLMNECGAMLWGRVTYEMMESYWPTVARGDVEASPAIRDWAVKLENKPKYVVSSTRKDYRWNNTRHVVGDLRSEIQKLKDATPAGVLLGSGKLATELDRLDLIDEYMFLVQPRIVGHGPTLYQSGLPSTRRLDLVSAKPFRCGAVALRYRRQRGLTQASASKIIPPASEPKMSSDWTPVSHETCHQVQGPFYHGTKAKLSIGDLLTPGHISHFESGRVLKHIYFAGLMEPAIWGAELAVLLSGSDTRGYVYVVEPIGTFEDDPNLTNKKFPGNITKSYRSTEPLRVVGVVEDWEGHPADVLQKMLDSLQDLRRRGLYVIED